MNSEITYTEVSSPYEDLSDIGSPRADDHEFLELPYIPEDPYVEAALQAPPSPDYVPGPEEPEQAPPSPDYVPGPEHADDEIVAEDQPQIRKEDERRTPEEDPIDYPADGGDDGDDEMDIEEDEDDDMDIDADEEDEDDEMDVEVDEEAEEEHSAPAYPVVVALPATAPSAEETEPFETDESAATPPPHPAYRMTARITILEPLPVPAWSDSEVARLLAISSPPASPLSPWSSSPPQIPFPLSPPSPVLNSTTSYIERILPEVNLPLGRGLVIALGHGYEVGESSCRCSSSLYHSLHPSGTPPLLPIPLPAPSTSRRADIPEADTPPRKRLLLTTPRPGCEIGESSAAAAARQPGPTIETRLLDTERRIMTALELVNRRVTYQVDVCTRESSEFCTRHHDAQKDRAAVRAEIEVLRRERLAYEQESIQTRQDLARSEAHCRALEARVTVLETDARRHEWQRQAADDLAVQHIMRTQALEAGARVDTLEDTGSSS
ncbi:hypothetical protein Tco_0091031 [Tanacetum coccineum]